MKSPNKFSTPPSLLPLWNFFLRGYDYVGLDTFLVHKNEISPPCVRPWLRIHLNPVYATTANYVVTNKWFYIFFWSFLFQSKSLFVKNNNLINNVLSFDLLFISGSNFFQFINLLLNSNVYFSIWFVLKKNWKLKIRGVWVILAISYVFLSFSIQIW